MAYPIVSIGEPKVEIFENGVGVQHDKKKAIFYEWIHIKNIKPKYKIDFMSFNIKIDTTLVFYLENGSEIQSKFEYKDIDEAYKLISSNTDFDFGISKSRIEKDYDKLINDYKSNIFYRNILAVISLISIAFLTYWAVPERNLDGEIISFTSRLILSIIFGIIFAVILIVIFTMSVGHKYYGRFLDLTTLSDLYNDHVSTEKSDNINFDTYLFNEYHKNTFTSGGVLLIVCGILLFFMLIHYVISSGLSADNITRTIIMFGAGIAAIFMGVRHLRFIGERDFIDSEFTF